MSETFTADEVYREFMDEIAEAGSQTAFARKIGVSDEMVSRMVHRNKPVCGKALRAIGFERRVVFTALARSLSEEKTPG